MFQFLKFQHLFTSTVPTYESIWFQELQQQKLRQFQQFQTIFLPLWLLQRQSWRLVTFVTLITILTIESLDAYNLCDLCDLTIKTDTGQHSRFLQCFVQSKSQNQPFAARFRKTDWVLSRKPLRAPVSTNVWKEFISAGREPTARLEVGNEIWSQILKSWNKTIYEP